MENDFEKLFDKSMGEAVVGVFVYMGLGSAVFLAGVIGVLLLKDAVGKISRTGL